MSGIEGRMGHFHAEHLTQLKTSCSGGWKMMSFLEGLLFCRNDKTRVFRFVQLILGRKELKGLRYDVG